MVNPSKYFTIQDFWAIMPIISNCFFEFLNSWFHYRIFPDRRFQWSKNVNVFYWFQMKSILQICTKISHPTGNFFLCAVFYVNHMFDHSLLRSYGIPSRRIRRRRRWRRQQRGRQVEGEEDTLDKLRYAEDLCPVYIDSHVSPHITPCGHFFCLPCVLRYICSSSSSFSAASFRLRRQTTSSMRRSSDRADLCPYPYPPSVQHCSFHSWGQSSWRRQGDNGGIIIWWNLSSSIG